MTRAKTPWRGMFPLLPDSGEPVEVVVTRDGDRTLIGDHRAIWDAAALHPYLPAVPETDGRYQIRGRRFLPSTDSGWMPSPETMHSALDRIGAELAGAPWMTLTDWSDRGYRVAVADAGHARLIPGPAADLIGGALRLRASDNPDAAIGVYRPADYTYRLVGMLQGLRADAHHPVMAAIVADAAAERRRPVRAVAHTLNSGSAVRVAISGVPMSDADEYPDYVPAAYGYRTAEGGWRLQDRGEGRAPEAAAAVLEDTVIAWADAIGHRVDEVIVDPQAPAPVAAGPDDW